MILIKNVDVQIDEDKIYIQVDFEKKTIHIFGESQVIMFYFYFFIIEFFSSLSC